MKYEHIITIAHRSILEYFDCKKYKDELEMLGDVDELTGELIAIIEEFKRKMHADSRGNAALLDITVEEYEKEDEEEE